MIDEPRGMGGWLLFFTVTLAARSVLGLLNGLGTLAKVSDTPGSGAVLGVLAAANLFVAIYSGWMTSLFWRLKPNAVRMLPGYFTCLLAYGLVVMALPYFRHDASSTKYLASWGPSGLAALIYVGIWVAYFK